ncbi:TcdA/TcdB pore-forming domain-containing protein [Silvanigrella aquatica]|uniref:TcdA/TcdB toxin pore forming domain-containing protein n=1 Tax=Silvanigrella aquatica TaxID=1915309 RepID=A0A1L4CY26_9BACT|nr:TcdA/TcdB pore-forming domain-containing protein [Silvanigrella aquatica]APJ02844.1 hypothetical protein AXG55_02475 [Silvanigrella aquatica]
MNLKFLKIFFILLYLSHLILACNKYSNIKDDENFINLSATASSTCNLSEIDFNEMNKFVKDNITEENYQKYILRLDKLIESLELQNLLNRNFDEIKFNIQNYEDIGNFLSIISIVLNEIRRKSKNISEIYENIYKLEHFETELNKTHEFIFNYLRHSEKIVPSLENIKEQDKNITHFFMAQEYAKKSIAMFRKYELFINKIKSKNNSLTSDHIPLLYGVDENSKTISFVKITHNESVNEDIIKVTLSEKEFHNFYEFKNFFHGLSQKKLATANQMHTMEEYEANISKAFAIQALFHYLNSGEIGEISSTLGRILYAHTYLNLSQIGLDLLSDSLKISKIIKLLNSSEFSFSNMSSQFQWGGALGKAISGMASLFGIVNMGFDIAELANSQNQLERATFSTQLFFDTSGVALGLSGLFGGAAVSAITGPLSVPLAGLGIGITAIVQQSELDNMQALESAKIFNKYENDHNISRLFYVKLEKNSENFISFASLLDEELSSREVMSSAVIKELNFTDIKKIKIKYGSSFIAKTNYAELASGKYNTWFPAFHPNPSAMGIADFINNKSLNKNDYVSLRVDLDIPENVEFLNENEFRTFILPIMPETFYSYGYDTTPRFKENNMDTPETRAITKLQMKKKFLFMYQYDCILREYAIRSIKRRFEKLEMTVKLGQESLHLVTPEIPELFYNKLDYIIQGNSGGKYVLSVQKGVHYHLNGVGDELFLINLSDLKIDIDKIKIDNYQFSIEGVHFTFDSKQLPGAVLLKDILGNLIALDIKNNLMQYIFYYNESNDIESLKNSLKKVCLSNNIKKEGYIEVLNFPKKIFNHKDKFKVLYDVLENKFVYPNFFSNNNSYLFVQNDVYYETVSNDLIQFIGKINKIYYFIDKSLGIVFSQSNVGEPITVIAKYVKNVYIFKNNLIVIDKNGFIISFYFGNDPTLVGIKNISEDISVIQNKIKSLMRTYSQLNIYNFILIDNDQKISYYMPEMNAGLGVILHKKDLL